MLSHLAHRLISFVVRFSGNVGASPLKWHKKIDRAVVTKKTSVTYRRYQIAVFLFRMHVIFLLIKLINCYFSEQCEDSFGTRFIHFFMFNSLLLPTIVDLKMEQQDDIHSLFINQMFLLDKKFTSMLRISYLPTIIYTTVFVFYEAIKFIKNIQNWRNCKTMERKKTTNSLWYHIDIFHRHMFGSNTAFQCRHLDSSSCILVKLASVNYSNVLKNNLWLFFRYYTDFIMEITGFSFWQVIVPLYFMEILIFCKMWGSLLIQMYCVLPYIFCDIYWMKEMW